MTRRLLIIIIIVLLILVGCGGASSAATTPEVLTPAEIEPLPAEATAESPDPAVEPEATATTEAQPTATEEPIPDIAIDSGPFERVASFDFAVDDQLFNSNLAPGPDPGSLWVYARQGAALYRDGASEIFSLADGELVVGVDELGRLWFSKEDGTEVGYFEADGTMVRYGLDEGWSLVEGISTTLEEPRIDSRGWVWVATPADVRVLRDGRWWIATPPALVAEPGTDSNPVISAYSLAMIGDQVWVGHCYYGPPGAFMDALGVSYFDGDEWGTTPVRDGCVRVVRQDGAGNLWVGSRDELWRFDAVSGEWSSQTLPPFEEAAFIYVEAFLLGPNGDIWPIAPACGGASCYGRGLIYHAYSDGSVALVAVSDSTVIDNWGIFPLKDGQTLLLWDRQLQTVDNDTLAPLLDTSVVDALQDDSGQVWATVWTELGLELWRLP